MIPVYLPTWLVYGVVWAAFLIGLGALVLICYSVWSKVLEKTLKHFRVYETLMAFAREQGKARREKKSDAEKQ